MAHQEPIWGNRVLELLAGRSPKENYEHWLRKWARGEGVTGDPYGPACHAEAVAAVRAEMVMSGEIDPTADIPPARVVRREPGQEG